ncbi:MAG: hypothetical protein ACJ76J_06625, partial [Thermoanaerobaculia bacterium]
QLGGADVDRLAAEREDLPGPGIIDPGLLGSGPGKRPPPWSWRGGRCATSTDPRLFGPSRIQRIGFKELGSEIRLSGRI